MDNIVTDVSTEKNDLSLSTELKFPLPPSRSPATERVEVLLEQYKVHQKSSKISQVRREDETFKENRHVICELELWNLVNDDLHSLNYKPIAFTADHTPLSSDHLVISLTASTIARHTVSSLIQEITRQDKKIKSLNQEISKMKSFDNGHEDIVPKRTPRQAWSTGQGQSSAVVPPSSPSGFLQSDQSWITAQLRQENKQLQEDLRTRPGMEEFKALQQKLEELMLGLQDKESQLLDFNICKRKVEELTQELKQKEVLLTSYRSSRTMVPPLKLHKSDDVIEEVKSLLSVSHKDQVLWKLRDVMAILDNHYKLEKFFSSLIHLVHHHSVPSLSPTRQEAGSGRHDAKPHHSLWCEVTWHHILETLRTWVFHMTGIQELQQVIGEVCKHLDLRPMPVSYSGNRLNSGEKENSVKFTCQELAILLRRWLLKDDHLKSSSQQLVLAMVRHFQHLFNVPRLEGVYPAMSVLCQHNQQYNTLLTRLKDCLSLDEQSSTRKIMSMLEYITQKENIDGLAKLYREFGSTDVSKLLEKLKLCDEFFPPFQQVITEMQRILGVDTLSGLIPALQDIRKKSQRV